MTFDLGEQDRLFGEKVTLEVPGPDGQIRKIEVTKAWLAEQERTGKISRLSGELIRVHVVSPTKGVTVETWEVGKHIAADVVARRRDPNDPDFYAIQFLKQGEWKTVLCDRSIWEEAKRKISAV